MQLKLSEQAALEIVRENSPIGLKELQQRMGNSRRTIFNAMRTLTNAGLVRRTMKLRDCRQVYFVYTGGSDV